MPEITVDRETLHAIIRKAGGNVGKSLYVEPRKFSDLADKLAHATATPGELIIKVIG